MKACSDTLSGLLEMAACLANALDDEKIYWAFGSSMVLKAHGLVEAPRDLDILVALNDVERAHKVLSKFGKGKDREPKSPYETLHFCEYLLEDGHSADLISGFTIVHGQKRFTYELERAQITKKYIEWETGSREFPFTSLEDWYLLYQLMGDREKKVRLIEKHLSKKLDEAYRCSLLHDIEEPSDAELAAVLPRLEHLATEQNFPEPIRQRLMDFCLRHTVRTFRCDVAYDGKQYSGWQTQKSLPTVQQTIEKTMSKILGHRVDIHGSGRTDAGVHARGQVFSFRTVMPLPLPNFLTAVNRLLPKDIVIVRSNETTYDFHARFDAQGKTYRYRIWNGEERDVFESDYSWHVPQGLDEEAMRLGAAYMVGTKDFRSFMASGSAITDTIRTVYSVSVERRGDVLELDFCGSGFLYNMVRIMTGLLVEIGLGKRKPNEVEVILASLDRTQAPLTAPPQGLYLMQVDYPNK